MSISAAQVPHWPAAPKRPNGAPSILLTLFDDVGFSDFGCHGSPIHTPNIDALAAQGLRYTGFHTTAMCSTTRAALLTGRNHHAVGMGCLANCDSGYPGYRGKIRQEAGTLAEMLRPHGWRNTMVGEWHVTPLSEAGPAGPYDGWPLGRGFDRFYGFMDAETDQYAPELVRDNMSIEAPGSHASGYHLSLDLVTQSIRYLSEHQAAAPDAPFLHWLAFGACHAPHQAPRELILKCDAIFARGWDVDRSERLARQIELGIVPPGTELPPRNDGVKAWADLSADEQRLFTRLQAAYAAMLEHADAQIGRLMANLHASGLAEDTLVAVLSDNGASQEGGTVGGCRAWGRTRVEPAKGLSLGAKRSCARRHSEALQRRISPFADPTRRAGTLCHAGRRCQLVVWPRHTPRWRLAWHGKEEQAGLDNGRDRGSPVSHYAAPFEFTGTLLKVTVTLAPAQEVDGAGMGRAEMGGSEAAPSDTVPGV